MKVRMNGPSRARTATRVVAVAAAAMLVLAGCRPQGGSFERQAKQIQRTSPEKRPWFCDSVGDGTPISGHGNGSHVHPVYEGRTKGPLSWEDCNKLAVELDKTVKATKGFETKGKAEANGWRQVAEYIPGLGTHHAKVPAGSTPGSIDVARLTQCLRDKGVDLSGGFPDLSDPAVVEALRACGAPLPGGDTPGSIPGGGFFSNTFDPANPQMLIFGGPQADAPLVGVAYAFVGGTQPPEAYAGGNDWWHLHQKVCVGPNREVLAGAEEIPDEECARLGGTQRQLSFGSAGGVWLLHVWLPPHGEYRPDIFVSGHNCLLEDGVAPASHPCWQIAKRDPSLGPPPTQPGDDHGHGPTTAAPTTAAPTTGPPVTTPTTMAPTTVAPTTAAPTTAPPTTTPPTTTPPGHGDHGH